MYRFKLTTRFKITIVLLALAVVLSIGAGLGYAFFFGSTNVNLNKGLVGHWKMDGNAKDATPNSNHGTVTGATLTTDRKGQSNKAYSFNGTSDYVQAGDTGFPIGTSSRTVGFWTKRAVSSNFAVGPYPFFYGTKTQYQGFGLYGVDGTTDINFYGHAYDFDTGINLDDTNWHYIAITFDGTNLRAYKDGVLISTTDRSLLNTVLGSNQFVVGSFKAVNQYWNGSIDDVRIYNRALTAAEVTALYESYNPGVVVSSLEQGLVGHWDFGDGSTTTATPDRTPYNNDGTLVADAVVNGSDRKGQSSKALTLDGTGDYVNVGGGQSFGTGDFSVSAWVKPASLLTVNVTANQAIVSDGEAISGADYPGWQLQWYQWDGWRFIAGAGVTSPFASIVPDTSAPAVWTHLVGVRTSTDVKLYVNGVVYSVDGAAQNVNNSVNQLIGEVYTFQYAGQTFNGLIDDVRIYNRALSAAEVTALYNSYDPGAVVSTLQKGLIGWWNFDGTAQDSTPYNNDGTVTGATLTTDRRSASNKAYLFNGTTDYIDVANESNFDFERTQSFSISQWFKTSVAGNQIIFGKQANSVNYEGYNTATISGKFRFSLFSTLTNAVTVDTTASVNDGVWHHGVATYNGNSAGNGVNLYIDGVLQGMSITQNNLTTSILNNINANIGIRNGAGLPFSGSIDDVRIYNRALSAAEVLALYNSYR